MSHAAPASQPSGSTPAADAQRAPLALAELTGAHLSFAHLVRGEWIKIRSLRSTWWCWGLMILVALGLAALVAANSATAGSHGTPGYVPVTGREAESLVVQVGTIGVTFVQLIAAVLGVLNISGEYSTGMIRSTFTAAPGRTGAILAKAAVLAVTTFVVSAIAIWGSVLVGWPLLHNHMVTVDLGEPRVFLPLLGASVYITLVSLLAFGFGMLLRSAAGGIATVLGLLLIAPIIAAIIYGFTNQAVWMFNIDTILPGNAGGNLYAYTGTSGSGFAPSPPHVETPQPGGGTVDGAIKAGVWILNGWGGFGVLAAWVAVVGGIAFGLVKRRDA